MMSEVKLQEQIELTTPNGHKVTIRGYATGRVRQAISAAYMKNTTVEFTGETGEDGKPKTKTVSTGLGGQDATNAALSGMVISVDGHTDEVLNRVLDLPEDDYDYVRTEVDKAATPLADRSSTDSPKTSTTSSTKA